MQPQGRALRRRMLGGELRRHRERAGLSVRQLAPLVKMQPGSISKIENARQKILPRNVILILTALGAPQDEIDRLVQVAEQEERETWWLPFGDTVPAWFRDYVDLEPDAARIATYSAELVDGLLQTPRYAEAVARVTEPTFTEEQLRRAVELREARQSVLDRPDAPQLHVVLNETVIRRPFGDSETMRGQFRHLATMAEHPQVTMQILPFAAGGHPAVKGPFTILRFAGEMADADCVYLENENAGVWQDRPEDVARYVNVFERTADLAMAPDETRRLLTTLAG